jgi:hypothetical protein
MGDSMKTAEQWIKELAATKGFVTEDVVQKIQAEAFKDGFMEAAKTVQNMVAAPGPVIAKRLRELAR